MNKPIARARIKAPSAPEVIIETRPVAGAGFQTTVRYRDAKTNLYECLTRTQKKACELHEQLKLRLFMGSSLKQVADELGGKIVPTT
jgi:hypothetical protein